MTTMKDRATETQRTGKVYSLPDAARDPWFALRENEHALGERMMGGNAQSIVKDGWLHHTSFLWEYYPENMAYFSLSLQTTRLPRRSWSERLFGEREGWCAELQGCGSTRNCSVAALKRASEDEFDEEVVTLQETSIKQECYWVLKLVLSSYPFPEALVTR